MNLSSLTIQQLRYLVAVDRYRSFGEAAVACHVSQPALSMQVKRLEEILGICVFDRTKHPIVVADKAGPVLLQARLALDHFDRIGLLVERETELAGTFRLGIIPTLVPTFVPLLVPQITRAHPQLDLEIVELRTADLMRSLREGALDAGVAATPLGIRALHERVICHEAFYVYLPDGHALAAKGRIHQADLVDQHVWLLSEGHCFRAQALHLCSVDRQKVSGSGSSVRFDGGSFETLAAVVDSGVGITILPELTVRLLSVERQATQVRPFVAPEPVRQISLIYAREQARAELTEAIFQALCAPLPPDVVARDPAEASIVPPV
jgi:LysR family hydrogen peroxide-inducible transcriptional activator